jgi:sulfite exporter TauE/SafE
LGRTAGKVMRRFAGRPIAAAFVLGAVLALMPCMIIAWTLGLAAVSGGAWQGAALMVLPVAMTTPVLLGWAAAPALVRPRRARAAWTAPASLALSGVWMLLMASAAAGAIDHAALHIGRYDVMFW